MSGCVETSNQEDADFIIVNTCSVREKAEETAIANISKLKYLNKKNPDVKVVVCGCMSRAGTFEASPERELRRGPGPVQENPGTAARRRP